MFPRRKIKEVFFRRYDFAHTPHLANYCWHPWSFPRFHFSGVSGQPPKPKKNLRKAPTFSHPLSSWKSNSRAGEAMCRCFEALWHQQRRCLTTLVGTWTNTEVGPNNTNQDDRILRYQIEVCWFVKKFGIIYNFFERFLRKSGDHVDWQSRQSTSPPVSIC